MSIDYKYILSGKFTGLFYTLQSKYLNAGESFPLNDLHEINIYRGIVSEAQLIDETEFDSFHCECNFFNINNIQINTAEQWPLNNDQIFQLGELKIKHIRLKNVHLLNEKTYGEIEGEIVANVLHVPNIESNENSNLKGEKNKGTKSEKKEDKKWNNVTPGNKNNNTNNSNGNNNGGENGNGFKWKGNWQTSYPLSNISKWFKWLLLILFLLYFISSCTKLGSNLKCYFELKEYEKEYVKVKQEADTLQKKLDKIKPNTPPCQIEKFNGTNEPRTYTYNTGTQNGVINIWYDMRNVPDRMEVYYKGKMVFETNDNIGIINIGGNDVDLSKLKGFARNKDSFQILNVYDPKMPSELLIRIIPNQTVKTTTWEFGVECPK
jgi:hypothetical protein